MKTAEEYTDAALSRVNQIRYHLGYPKLEELPKGIQTHSTECPVARAFKDILDGIEVEPGYMSFEDFHMGRIFKNVWGTGYAPYPEGGNMVIHTPKELLEFADEFDNGRIPQLIEDEDA